MLWRWSSQPSYVIVKISVVVDNRIRSLKSNFFSHVLLRKISLNVLLQAFQFKEIALILNSLPFLVYFSPFVFLLLLFSFSFLTVNQSQNVILFKAKASWNIPFTSSLWLTIPKFANGSSKANIKYPLVFRADFNEKRL